MRSHLVIAVTSLCVVVKATAVTECATAMCALLPGPATIRRFKTQGYATCQQSITRRAQQQSDCVRSALSRVTDQRQCLCAATPVNTLLTAGLVTAIQLKMAAPTICADMQALQRSATCPQRVKECVRTAASLHGSVSMLRGSRHNGQCTASQRAKVATLNGCFADLKQINLSGCHMWKKSIEMFSPFVKLTLPLVCAGCDIQGLVRECLAPSSIRSRQPLVPPGPCERKAHTERTVTCLHSKMAAAPSCSSRVALARQIWSKFQELSYFKAMDEGCKIQRKYERAATALSCPTLTPRLGRGKRDVEKEDDLVDIIDPLGMLTGLLVE